MKTVGINFTFICPQLTKPEHRSQVAQGNGNDSLHNFAGVFWLEMLPAAQESGLRSAKFNNINHYLVISPQPFVQSCMSASIQ